MNNCKPKSFRDCHKSKSCLSARFSISIIELAERSIKMHVQKDSSLLATHIYTDFSATFSTRNEQLGSSKLTPIHASNGVLGFAPPGCAMHQVS